MRRLEKLPEGYYWCVTYRRVSSQRQAKEGYSFANDQPQQLDSIVGRNSLKLAQAFDDVESAGTANRSGLKDLMQFCIKYGVKHIVAMHFDRLFRLRSLKERGEILEWLIENKIVLVTDQGVLDPNTTQGRLYFELMGMMAAWYLEALSDRITLSWEGHKTRREYRANRLFGYVLDNSKKPTQFVKHETNAAYVTAIFDGYLAGKSVTQLADEMNGTDIKTARGKMWRPFSISNILKTSVYTGWVISEGLEPFEAVNVEPIITLTDWRKVQTKLAKKKSVANRSKTSTAPWTPVLYCATCGSKFHTYSTRADGSWSIGDIECGRRYYTCFKRLGSNGCKNNKSIREDKLIAELLKIASIFFGARIAETRIDEQIDVNEVIRDEIAIIQTKRDRLLDVYADGLLNKDDFQARIVPLNNQIDALTTKIVDANTQMYALPIADVNAMFNIGREDELRDMLVEVIKRIEISNGEVVRVVINGMMPVHNLTDLGYELDATG